MVSVRATEMGAYLSEAQRTYQTVHLMTDEFTGISQSWTLEIVSLYWTRQFTLNLLKRLRLMQKAVLAMRPSNPELLQIHTEYEKGLETFGLAFEAFEQQIDFPNSDGIAEVNFLIRDGNRLLENYQILLSNLVGTQIRF